MATSRVAPGGSVPRAPKGSSLITKNGRTKSSSARFGSPALQSPIGNLQYLLMIVVIAFVNFGAMPVGRGEGVCMPNARYTGNRNRMAFGPGADMIAPKSSLQIPRLFSSTGTRPRPGAAGPGADCRPRWSGRQLRLANQAPTAIASPA